MSIAPTKKTAAAAYAVIIPQITDYNAIIFLIKSILSQIRTSSKKTDYQNTLYFNFAGAMRTFDTSATLVNIKHKNLTL